jgi:N-hydroxyarylamine O-acetyltransferase
LPNSESIDLDAYFERTGYGGSTQPDFDTLAAIHRSHLTSIPYENLEIQLGREKTIGEGAFFDALVGRRRGGWCYEMNGLLTTVLRELEFEVTRIGGAVARKLIGDDAIGNHMVGIVDIDGTRFVADVGLGDGPLEPFELKEGSWSEGEFTFSLEKLDHDWWRFHNHAHGLAPSFDFTEEVRSLDWYRPMCARLQVDPNSPFVNYAMTFRRTQTGARSLRDTTLFEVTGAAMSEHQIDDETEYTTLITELLDCDLGEEITRLWTAAQARTAARALE